MSRYDEAKARLDTLLADRAAGKDVSDARIRAAQGDFSAREDEYANAYDRMQRNEAEQNERRRRAEHEEIENRRLQLESANATAKMFSIQLTSCLEKNKGNNDVIQTWLLEKIHNITIQSDSYVLEHTSIYKNAIMGIFDLRPDLSKEVELSIETFDTLINGVRDRLKQASKEQERLDEEREELELRQHRELEDQKKKEDEKRIAENLAKALNNETVELRCSKCLSNGPKGLFEVKPQYQALSFRFVFDGVSIFCALFGLKLLLLDHTFEKQLFYISIMSLVLGEFTYWAIKDLNKDKNKKWKCPNCDEILTSE